MERRIYAYTQTGEYQGYVRLGQDDIGNIVGEIYNTQADRLGAVQYLPTSSGPKESLVYNQDGAQIGYARLEKDGATEGDIYIFDDAGEETNLIANIYLDDYKNQEEAEVSAAMPDGEIFGSLKPENVSNDELLLIGAGAALMLLM